MPATYGGAAAVDTPGSQKTDRTERFSDRARALFYARLAFLGIGLMALAVPSWSTFLGITSSYSFIIYFAVIAYSVTNYLLIDHPKHGRTLTYVTLVLDLIALTALVLPSGGLRSPMMAAHVMFTIFFALLFPRMILILPPILMLLTVAFLDLFFKEGTLVPHAIFMILWYGTLSLIAAYVLLYLQARDKKHTEQLKMLSKAQENAIITDERLRLAREIHDGLGGALSTLIIHSEFIQRLAKDPELKAEVTELKEQAEEAIEELRRSLTMMRRDFDLHKALEDRCMRFQERARCWCGFKVSGRPRRLPSEMQLTIFRILQECLTNAQKHAEAKNVQVKLKYDGDICSLTISDDGAGFDLANRKKSGHYGLSNIEARAMKFRGTIDIQSKPGDGTTVHASLVIPAEGSHVAFIPEGL